MLVRTGLAMLGLGCVPSLFGAAAPGKKRKVLFFSKSSGFEHSVIQRHNGELSFAEKLLQQWGPEQNIEYTFSKDGSLFKPEYLAQFDAFHFHTTGVLTEAGTDKNPPMTPEGKQAFLDAIHGGKGFIGTHCAADTFHSPNHAHAETRYKDDAPGQTDPYIAMLGGEFIIHGSEPRLQTTDLIVNDPKFPGLEGVASPVEFTEEWYSLKDFAPDLHVILSIDTSKLKGPCYQRHSYPGAWARMHGKGRVFFTAIGDRVENWQNPFFLNHLAGGIRWSLGEVNASIPTNLATATPGYADIPPQQSKKI